MSAKIQAVRAREIIAGRGVVSLEVTVETEDGALGVSTPESGVSTGTHEASFLLDGGERYGGKGVRKAAENVNTIIGPALVGMDVADQAAIDRTMIELDGTPNKARLGANAIVGVSLAALKAAAEGSGQPLYRMVGGVGARTLPIPIYGIGTGGRYRDPGTSRWFKPSYEFCAFGAGGYASALEWSWRCERETRLRLRRRLLL
jgi:enolase